MLGVANLGWIEEMSILFMLGEADVVERDWFTPTIIKAIKLPDSGGWWTSEKRSLEYPGSIRETFSGGNSSLRNKLKQL
jgi:hypothetical protein